LTYLLDTNVCIRLLNNTSPAVASRLAERQAQDIYLCTVVQMELYYGAYRSAKTKENIGLLERFFSQFRILPFDPQAARLAGDIRSQLAALGTPIGPYDLQIAAIALANDMTLVTHNTAEFGRVTGLQIEDWEVTI
jgi:tRNA(fMet)-specific endonuclease VapC